VNFRSKLVVLTGAMALSAAPAFAAQGPPAQTPPGYNATSNPGSSHVPTGENARAIGRKECQEFKLNFADNKQQFGKCVSAAAMAIRTELTPRQACAEVGLSRKPQGDERRSDFSACVIAGARAQREAAGNRSG
jgi:uncharacterized protein YcfJ